MELGLDGYGISLDLVELVELSSLDRSQVVQLYLTLMELLAEVLVGYPKF